MGDAGDAVAAILGKTLRPTGVDGAAQRDFAVGHRNLDLRGVDPGVIGQPVVHILFDAGVRPDIAPGAATAMVGLAPGLGLGLQERLLVAGQQGLDGGMLGRVGLQQRLAGAVGAPGAPGAPEERRPA